MSEQSRPRKRRTFSAFGDVRRMPSEYEIVTHGQNWTTRANRPSAFEQNPSSPPNLWFLTYRENSPLRVEDWDGFRDPDALTYRTYVNLQSDGETRVASVLEEYADADAQLSPGWLSLLGTLHTPSRYLAHGCQQIQAYIGYMAPTSYVTNAAAFASADFLRRVTTLAYRTRELQLAHPQSGIGTADRQLWETHEAWQPARRAIEKALIAYDWAEAFTALNLVLAPTLDDVFNRQFKEVARANGDESARLLSSFLQVDNDRRNRWSAALGLYAIQQRPQNADVLRRWVDRWSPIADDAAQGLGALFESLPEHGRSSSEVLAGARSARAALLERVFHAAKEGGSAEDVAG
jgi:toluene monooxygenase system protein E